MANHEINAGPKVGAMRSTDTPLMQPPDALLDGFLASHANVEFALRAYAEVSDILEVCSIPSNALDAYLHNVLYLGSKGYASAIKSVLNATTPDISRIDVFGSSSLADYELIGGYDDAYEEDIDLEIGDMVAYEYAQLVEALEECDIPDARLKLDFITHIFATGGQNNLERQSIFLFLENRLSVKKANSSPGINSK
jgi:hypothetical protein